MTHERISSTFDAWARNGRAEAMESGHGDVVRQVLAQLSVKAGEQILDLGCGNGWATRLLARSAPGTSAVGVDVAPAMIARAEELTSYTIRARYEVGAFEALPFKDASFDRVFSMEALYYSIDLDGAIGELLRVTRPGATVDIIIDCFAESPSTRSWSALVGLPMHCLGEAEWKQRFEHAGFRDVLLERVIDTRSPGEEAQFKASEHCPDWQTKVALHRAGSLWIHARKPTS